MDKLSKKTIIIIGSVVGGVLIIAILIIGFATNWFADLPTDVTTSTITSSLESTETTVETTETTVAPVTEAPTTATAEVTTAAPTETTSGGPSFSIIDPSFSLDPGFTFIIPTTTIDIIFPSFPTFTIDFP